MISDDIIQDLPPNFSQNKDFNSCRIQEKFPQGKFHALHVYIHLYTGSFAVLHSHCYAFIPLHL